MVEGVAGMTAQSDGVVEVVRKSGEFTEGPAGQDEATKQEGVKQQEGAKEAEVEDKVGNGTGFSAALQDGESELVGEFFDTEGPRFSPTNRLLLRHQDSLQRAFAAASLFSSQTARIASETWLLTQLAWKLLVLLGIGYQWMVRTLALLVYATLLLPGFIHMLAFYFFSQRVRPSVEYSPKPRNRLDLYFPRGWKPRKHADPSKPRYPVLIFVSGGAWVIGYKAWAILQGRHVSARGVIVACLDYRNFPQGCVDEMLEDVTTGIAWVFQNIHRYGGDPSSVVLAGQSAGAHLATLAVVNQAKRKAAGQWVEWSSSHVRTCIGISGGYDLEGLKEHLHSRGLYKSIFLRMFNGQDHLAKYSPVTAVQQTAFTEDRSVAAALMPPFLLLHGNADKSMPSSESTAFAAALEKIGVPVTLKVYEGKGHTDPILQDPMEGGIDYLAEDLAAACLGKAYEGEVVQKKTQPHLLAQWARMVCPF
eukprot:jgi/Chlat1/2742/Chrsp187S00193